MFAIYSKNHFLDFLSYEFNTSIWVVCMVFVILIFNDFKLKVLRYELRNVNFKISSILLVAVLITSLHLTIYFIQIVLSALLIGETFTINLVTYFRGFQTSFVAILLVPFLEEIFFRQSILRQFTKVYSKGKSLVISTALFALAHYFSDTGLLWVFAIGLFLAFLLEVQKYSYGIFWSWSI